ncbi:hypothetical protein NDU88_004441, partial [Pleurodeles waltl]
TSLGPNCKTSNSVSAYKIQLCRISGRCCTEPCERGTGIQSWLFSELEANRRKKHLNLDMSNGRTPIKKKQSVLGTCSMECEKQI